MSDGHVDCCGLEKTYGCFDRLWMCSWSGKRVMNCKCQCWPRAVPLTGTLRLASNWKAECHPNNFPPFSSCHIENALYLYYKATSLLPFILSIIRNPKTCLHAAGSAVGWGTVLQDGRSRVRFPTVSLKLFIDTIVPVALRPWGSTQPLTEMSTWNISWG
jgi:hypothetical protein